MHLAAFFTSFTRLTAVAATDKKSSTTAAEQQPGVATAGDKPAGASGSGDAEKPSGHQEGADAGAPSIQIQKKEDLTPSPFAVISSTMGMETFHFVISTWLGQVDIPAKSDLKDWPLQVGVWLLCAESACRG
jgi:hypothetical protein